MEEFIAPGTDRLTKIESWEDRSKILGDPDQESFGYVYFDDGSRVGYAPQAEGHEDVWEPQTNGGGLYKPVTKEQLKVAAAFLRAHGVWVKDPR